MKKSGAALRAPFPRASFPAQFGLFVVETLARVSVPVSVFLLASGSGRVAAISSTVALFATIGRGFVQSFVTEAALRTTFDAVIASARSLALVDLRAERKMGLLAEAARETAVYEATMMAHVGAHVVALSLTSWALWLVLGPMGALALVLAAVPLVLALGLGARRIRAEQQVAWAAFGEMAIDLRVLVEACLELRAHDREASFSEALSSRARTFARAERRASMWSAGSAAVPSLIVFVSSATPLSHRLASTIADTTGAAAAEAAIVCGAALYFSLGLGRLLEQRARYAPFRETLRTFMETAPPSGPETDDEAALGALSSPSFRDVTFVFDNVSCVHPSAVRPTPEGASFTWRAGRGVLLSGENGAGKTTLAMAFLGLLPLHGGSILADGEPLSAARSKAMRAQTAYLAQSPFVEPGASVAWHMRLLSRELLENEAIDAALRHVGLFRTLAEHAKKDGRAPRDVLVGELSGGERQRMHIARLLAQKAEILILDEPEAGLDQNARTEVAKLLSEVAAKRRVLMIAHDPAVVPVSFERFEVRARAR